MSLAFILFFLKAIYSDFVPTLEDHSILIGEKIKALSFESASDESESEESLDGAVPTSDEDSQRDQLADQTREIEMTDMSSHQ